MATIVLAEDCAEQRLAMKMLLEAAGHNVHEACDGVHAYAMVQSHRPDIVITDWQMPNMDGIAVCKAIKNNPELKEIPVILIGATYWHRSGPGLHAWSAFLMKPVASQALLRLCTQFCEIKPAGPYTGAAYGVLGAK